VRVKLIAGALARISDSRICVNYENQTKGVIIMTYYLNQSPTSGRFYYRAVRFDAGWAVTTKSGKSTEGTAITGDETKLPAGAPRTILLAVDFAGELHDEVTVDVKNRTLTPVKQ
jgi:hypothetical protein